MRARLLLTAATITITSALVAAPAVSAQATVHTVKATSDLTGAVLTCPSEDVVFSGAATVTETDITTPSGERTGQFLFNLNGLTATGQTSGAQYRVVGVTSTGFTFPIGALLTADTSRFIQTWLLVPLGGGTPLSFQEVLVVVFDANGDPVALVFRGPSDCD